jgi:receptor expression-enhancing protein 1/2/3/4
LVNLIFSYRSSRVISQFSRLPFYWEIKTIFILFLALPQTQGSTLIYRAYLQPFFVRNEADLDAGIIAVQSNGFTFLQDRFSKAWDIVLGALKKVPNAGTHATNPGQPSASPTSLPWESAMGLWNQYGPYLMSAFQPRAPASQAPPFGPVTASTTSVQSGGTPSAQHRPPFLSTPSGLTPTVPFPEPQHFQ